MIRTKILQKCTSLANKSVARRPCKTGRPFSTNGLYTEAWARGLNAAGPGKKKIDGEIKVYMLMEYISRKNQDKMKTSSVTSCIPISLVANS